VADTPPAPWVTTSVQIAGEAGLRRKGITRGVAPTTAGALALEALSWLSATRTLSAVARASPCPYHWH
jgi:hypothetical protein